MKDRYLFKAKRISDGEWVVGYIVRYGHTRKEKYYIIPNYASDLYSFLIDENTICQCTGLKDKNGRLIWENDIVECTRGNAIVEWDRVDWKIRWIEESIWRRDLRHWSIDDAEGIRFLGNIFDNKDLLESEE